jgi:hypothetical protein
MTVSQFRDDDAGYLQWVTDHRDGYVLSIPRSHTRNAARLHRAACPTISGTNPHGGPWTGPYVKLCAQHLPDLQNWATETVGEHITPCGRCRPSSTADQRGASEHSEAVGANILQRDQRPHGDATEERTVVQGPETGRAVVEAWADDYIRFDHRPPWQEELRTELRRRCQRLVPSSGDVLHATFSGAKLPNADVENLLIYNIDSFKVAGANGIRFEHNPDAPTSPAGVTYPFAYRYELAPRFGTFQHWRPGRTLASFDWTRLDDTAEATKLAHVWWALVQARNHTEAATPDDAVGIPFAVRVQIRPPHGSRPVWGGLVKGIFDGVICAFHSHTDMAILPEVTTRLSAALHAEPHQIARQLTAHPCAMLGAVHRLVAPYRDGVKWDPADHWCVAGELLPAEPDGPHWAIRGDLIEAIPSALEREPEKGIEGYLDAADVDPADARDARHFRRIIAAREALASAQAELAAAVAAAHDAGDSWDIIAAALGTSRQVAYQQFANAARGS